MKKVRSRRDTKIIAFIIAIVFLVSLTACQANNQSNSTTAATTVAANTTAASTTQAAATAPKEKVKIKMVMWGSGCATTYRKIEEAFNSQHPNIEIQMEMPPGDTLAYLATCLATGEMPDLYYCNPYLKVQDLAKNGKIMDLSNEEWVKRIYPYALPAVSYDSKIYAFPTNSDFISIYYNVDMFNNAGLTPPKTLSELENVCKVLKSKGITPFSAALMDTWVTFQSYCNMLASNLGDAAQGVKWVEDMNAGKGTFRTSKIDGIVKCLQIIGKNCTPKPESLDYNGMVTEFATGKAAMFINGTWAIGDVRKITPDIKVGAFAYPISEDPNDAKVVADVTVATVLDSTSKNPDAAKTFLNWMADPDKTETYTDYMAKETCATPCFKYNPLILDLSVAGDEYQKYVNDGLTVPMIQSLFPNGMESEMTAFPGQLLLGKMTADQMVKKCDEAWAKLIAK